MGPVGTSTSQSVSLFSESSKKSTVDSDAEKKAKKQKESLEIAEDRLLPKRKIKKITPEQVKIIRQHLPDLDAKKIMQKDIRAELATQGHPIPESTLSKTLKKIRKGIDPLVRKTSQKVTAQLIESIREELPRLEKGKKRGAVAEQLKIAPSTLNNILSRFETGQDPSKRKKRTKTTDELVKKVKEVSLELEATGKAVTYVAVASQCGITAGHARRIVMKLEKDKNPVNEGPKIGQKTIEKVNDIFKEVSLLVQQGKLTPEQAADKCGITQKVFDELQAAKKNKEKEAMSASEENNQN